MTSTTTAHRIDAEASVDRRGSLVLSLLLLLAGVLVAVTPVLVVVRTADASPTVTAVGAGFAAVLPGLLAIGLAVRRPVLGLAAAAGAGVVGVVRVLTDLAVLTEPDRITRPELFAETTDRARPFAAGAGGWLLLAADLLWLTVGIVAAIRLAPAVAELLAPPEDGFFRPPAGDQPVPDDTAGDEPDDVAVVGPALGRSPPPGRRPLNLPMIAVGFLGAVLLMVGALGTPYQGGYLALRVLPFGSSLTGLVAAALLGFVAAVVVVVAAALPRGIAAALLGGAALAAAVPSLTAVVAVLAGAPTNLSPVVWCGVAGAAILAAAALLARRPARSARPESADGAPPARWMTVGTGVAAVLGAAALVGAWRFPLLYLDGAAPDRIAGGALLPAALPHLVAAVPLGVAGVLALLPQIASAGRAALTVVWAGSVYAFGQALWVRSLVLSTAGDTTGGAIGTEHSWTTAPGQWFSLLGVLFSITAAVLATMTSRAVSQASLEVIDDRSLAASRVARRWPAAGVTVLVLVALAVPTFSDLTGPGPSLLRGYDLDTWGLWVVLTGAAIGIWAAALTARAPEAVAWSIGAAAVVAQPLFVPEPVRAIPGFAVGVGFWLQVLAVAALLATAGWFGAAASRVRRLQLAPVGGAGGAGPFPPAGKDGPGSASAPSARVRGRQNTSGGAGNKGRGAASTGRSGSTQGPGTGPGRGSSRAAQPKGR